MLVYNFCQQFHELFFQFWYAFGNLLVGKSYRLLKKYCNKNSNDQLILEDALVTSMVDGGAQGRRIGVLVAAVTGLWPERSSSSFLLFPPFAGAIYRPKYIFFALYKYFQLARFKLQCSTKRKLKGTQIILTTLIMLMKAFMIMMTWLIILIFFFILGKSPYLRYHYVCTSVEKASMKALPVSQRHTFFTLHLTYLPLFWGKKWFTNIFEKILW